ncbi:MAG: hypothetical protein V4504_01275 [Patescibacteria group bacterium]
MKKNLSTYLLATFIVITSFFVSFNTIQASKGDNIYGWGWSDGTGWISLNSCTNPADSSTCTGPDYGLNYDATKGNITGYAWSDNIGWIQFGDLIGMPSAGTQAKIDFATGKLSGWARAWSLANISSSSPFPNDNETSGGIASDWADGWISLSSTNSVSSPLYGVSFNLTSGLPVANSYAWGSNVNGWISFTQAKILPHSITTPTLNLIATDESTGTVSSGGLLTVNSDDYFTLSASGTGLNGGSATVGGDDTINWTNRTTVTCPTTVPIAYAPHIAFIIPGSVAETYTYTITCTKSTGGTISSTVKVKINPGLDPKVLIRATEVLDPSNTVQDISTSVTQNSPIPKMTVLPGHTINIEWGADNVEYFLPESCVATNSLRDSHWNFSPLGIKKTITPNNLGVSSFVPTDDAIYTVTCIGSGKSSKQEQVFVANVMVTINKKVSSLMMYANGVSGTVTVGQSDPISLSSIGYNLNKDGTATGNDITNWNSKKDCPSVTTNPLLYKPDFSIDAPGTYIYTLNCDSSLKSGARISGTVTVIVQKKTTQYSIAKLRVNGVEATGTNDPAGSLSETKIIQIDPTTDNPIQFEWSMKNIRTSTAQGITFYDCSLHNDNNPAWGFGNSTFNATIPQWGGDLSTADSPTTEIFYTLACNLTNGSVLKAKIDVQMKTKTCDPSDPTCNPAQGNNYISSTGYDCKTQTAYVNVNMSDYQLLADPGKYKCTVEFINASGKVVQTNDVAIPTSSSAQYQLPFINNLTQDMGYTVHMSCPTASSDPIEMTNQINVTSQNSCKVFPALSAPSCVVPTATTVSLRATGLQDMTSCFINREDTTLGINEDYPLDNPLPLAQTLVLPYSETSTYTLSCKGTDGPYSAVVRIPIGLDCKQIKIPAYKEI